MEIRKFQVVTTKHILIYGGVGLFLVAGFLTAIVSHGVPAGVRIGAAAGIAATVYAITQLWLARRDYARAIGWYTPTGVAIIPNGAVLSRPVVDRAISGALTWWADRYPTHADRMASALNGLALKVFVQDEPLKDRRHGVTGRGLNYGGEIHVLWQPRDAGKDFIAIVQHEIGHVCLYALGSPGEDHHGRMKRESCPFA